MQKACQALEIRLEATRLVINDLLVSDITFDPDNGLKPYWVAYYHTALLNIKKLLEDEATGMPTQLIAPKPQPTEQIQEFGVQDGQS